MCVGMCLLKVGTLQHICGFTPGRNHSNVKYVLNVSREEQCSLIMFVLTPVRNRSSAKSAVNVFLKLEILQHIDDLT
jgi:hypothetical protein